MGNVCKLQFEGLRVGGFAHDVRRIRWSRRAFRAAGRRSVAWDGLFAAAPASLEATMALKRDDLARHYPSPSISGRAIDQVSSIPSYCGRRSDLNHASGLLLF